MLKRKVTNRKNGLELFGSNDDTSLLLFCVPFFDFSKKQLRYRIGSIKIDLVIVVCFFNGDFYEKRQNKHFIRSALDEINREKSEEK